MSSVPQGSGSSPAGRSTATISVAQTAPIRIHHLTENLCADDGTLRRALSDVAEPVNQLSEDVRAVQFWRFRKRGPRR